jgi:hypothetical protein
LTLVARNDRQQKTPSGRDGVNKRAKGVEPDTNLPVSTEKSQISDAGAPKASPLTSPPLVADADLAALIATWSILPDAIKAGIVAMVKASNADVN